MMPPSLQGLLDAHVPADAAEAHSLAEMRRLLPRLDQPLSRQQPEAHFTASALVVDVEAGKIALLYHAKLRRWLQPGGHAEPGDGGLMHVTALREAREETGCEVRLHHPTPTLFDVDVHPIPARGDEPAHHHLDLRFLMVAEDPQRLTLNADESSAVGWFGFDEAIALVDDEASRRLIRKGQWALEALRTR
ncbi:MAG: NUDIX hydrolase [Gammaproteobacteria bacterium]|nr:NUDIX hydrolase [Gammaproteobacteria bacterium]